MGLNCEKNMYILPLILLIILPLLINNVTGQTQGFRAEPSNIEVRQGEEGILQCILDNRDGSKCFWSKTDQEVSIDGIRYIFTGNQANGDCSIKITGSNFERDDGAWACGIPQTSEVSGLKSRLANYTVLFAENEPIIKVNGESIANGSDIVMSIPTDMQATTGIECWFENSNPAASLSWVLGEMQLSGNQSQIPGSQSSTQTAILALTAQFDETWQNEYLACVATHAAYDGSKIAYGIVRSPAPITTVTLTTLQNSGDIHVATDDQVTVTCTADGYPPPDLKLQKRNSESDPWQDFQSSSEQANVYNFTFRAIDAQIICVASNDDWFTSTTSPTAVKISTDSTSNAQVGTIIAIVVVCVVAVVIMGAGVFTCYKKKMCLFKVHDPVEHGKKGDTHEGKKDPTHLESGELAPNQVPLLNELNEKQHNGNQQPDMSPNVNK